MTAIRRLALTATLSVTTAGALAHHSVLPFDDAHGTVVTGTVTRFLWQNPHTLVALEVVEPDGSAGARTSSLVAFGQPGGDSAMARTVALPAAAAARLILDGRIAATGVRIPVDPEIYEPVLAALEPLGIVFREGRTTP